MTELEALLDDMENRACSIETLHMFTWRDAAAFCRALWWILKWIWKRERKEARND